MHGCSGALIGFNLSLTNGQCFIERLFIYIKCRGLIIPCKWLSNFFFYWLSTFQGYQSLFSERHFLNDYIFADLSLRKKLRRLPFFWKTDNVVHIGYVYISSIDRYKDGPYIDEKKREVRM